MGGLVTTRRASQSGISALNKGIGFLEDSAERIEIASRGWSLLNEDLTLPTAVLYRDKVLHNLKWMQQFIEAYGVRLAPHGKTTMAPRLFQMQLDHGAWGITLATAHQTLVAYTYGVRRILMANQLVGRENMAIISRLLRDSEFTFYCLVDSSDQIDLLGAYFSERKQRLNVLIELGVVGGRAGVRDEKQLQSVLSALSRWGDSISLSGVEIYEGVLHDESEIRSFLQRAVELTRKLLGEKRFGGEPVLLSGAGSAWYDVVAEVFSGAGFGEQVEIILRPGCYITHDVGSYREAQARILKNNPIASRTHDGLVPALHVWACVQSIPEAGKAIIGLGRRDAAFDSGLPVPAVRFRPGMDGPVPAPVHWSLSKFMDQHAFMDISTGDDLRVGDMIGFDIKHPCLTFDKWRVLPLLDANYRVVDIIETFF
jgi:D-serine dehydratase